MIPIGSLSYVSADNERVSFGSLLAKLLDASSAWRDARQERGECCAALPNEQRGVRGALCSVWGGQWCGSTHK